MLGSGGGSEAGDVVAHPLSSTSSISPSSVEGSHSGLGLRSAFSFTLDLLFDGRCRRALNGLDTGVRGLDLLGVGGAELGDVALGNHTPGSPTAGRAQNDQQAGERRHDVGMDHPTTPSDGMAGGVPLHQAVSAWRRSHTPRQFQRGS